MKFERIYENIKDVSQVYEQPTTAPAKPETPTKPHTPSQPSTPSQPTKTPSPLKPAPGINPKPKASQNKDIELFMKARSNLKEMAFDPGDFPSFIDPKRKEWIESDDEQLAEILPQLTEGEQKYVEMLASKSYKEMLTRLEKYTGERAADLDIPQIMSIVMQALANVTEVESKNKKQLEELALTTVLELPEFEMVKDAYENGDIKFDIALGPAELKLDADVDMEAEEGELSGAEEINLELAKAFEGMSDERLKRRLANILIQGNSVLKLYLFKLVEPELNKIDDSLAAQYGILSVIAQLGYWVMPPGAEQAAAQGEDTAAGSEEVIPDGDDYIIKIRAQAFPFLVHELTKGIYEWISIDPDVEKAMELDSLEQESEDIIIGPELAKIIGSYIPADKQHLLPLVHKKILQLSREQVKDVFAKSKNGEGLVAKLMRDASNEWADYKKEKAASKS